MDLFDGLRAGNQSLFLLINLVSVTGTPAQRWESVTLPFKNEYGFRQITKDHSFLNDLVKDFDFNEEEIKSHINKNIITRAVGTSPNVKVDSVVLELEKGSYILLCSDGLTNELSDEIIAHNIKDELPLKEIGDNLIDSANQNGGRDNISLCIFKLR